MATFPYTIGESGTLGFPVFQYDGTPLPTDGLGVRLVVYLPGADLILTGTWESGSIDIGNGPVIHSSIASFAVTPENMPLAAKPYSCGLQIDDGSGWRTIDTHLIDVRRP